MGAKKYLTDDRLREMCSLGMSDRAIGECYGMTGEGIAYRRKKIGLVIKVTKHQRKILEFKKNSKEILSQDYYSMTTENFSKKYGVSKTIWLPHLRSLGISGKDDKRINSYPPFTIEQRRWIIGGLLGDGGIDEGLSYYEFHSYKQEGYIRKKNFILKPYSKEIRPSSDNTGLCIKTVSHPNFKEFRDNFYDANLNGKIIPVDYIWKWWGDEILSCWYFDDGNIDDTCGDLTISNKCPNKNQLDYLVNKINEHYGWNINSGTQGDLHRLYFPRNCLKEFGDILLKFSTEDLYYKIPEVSLPQGLPVRIDSENVSPKIYRSADDTTKRKIENELFIYYRRKGFPYSVITEDRLKYMTRSFTNKKPKESGGIIGHNSSGLALCEHFFPNIYSCSRQGYESPKVLWDSDKFLRKLIKNRLKYSNKINDSAMRRGIKLSKYCVSNFKPMIAYYLYKKYCNIDKVYDYSAGFGSRMLAAMSLGLKYIACEPCKETAKNLRKFGSYLKKELGGDFDIIESGSEIYIGEYYDFIFSSPPYFDFEKYSEDEGQSIKRFPVYSDWLEKYWRKTIQNGYRMLTDNGRFGVCLSPYGKKGILHSTLKMAREEGFYFEKDYKCPFKQVLGGSDKYEIVLIFSKRKKEIKNPVFDLRYSNNDEEFKKDLINFRKIYSNKDYDNAKKLFKKYCKSVGFSRKSYTDPSILGVPSHVLDHHFKGWNNFIRQCGLEPQHEFKSPGERVQKYFEVCIKYNKVLSFYEYEKYTKDSCSGLKRIFNKGKKYHHLKNRLFHIALKPEFHSDFLKNFV